MIQIKLCVLGAFAVGKTSLVGRYTRGIFSERYLATLGVKIDRKVVKVGGREVNLILWDMAGEDEFAKVNTSYLKGAGGYLLVIDGTRRATLDEALVLERRVRDTVGEVPFLVLVNKNDVSGSWEISTSDLEGLRARNWTLLRTSAKSGEGVEAAFQELTESLCRRLPPGVA